ncbi:hypothetical protein [Streptomyces sp. NPDC093108]|uniref:hypothetical protein n=1 Tax=Streptomyces sp. NPDC093108 TaxID=3366030 RepID=UPI0038094D77
MASITDRSDGETYEGNAPESIVRRIWGSSARLEGCEQVDALTPTSEVYLSMVVRTAHGSGAAETSAREVLANVTVRP